MTTRTPAVLMLLLMFSIASYPLSYPETKNIDEVLSWVEHNITYELESPYRWRAPSETLTNRRGMCVDYASLVLQRAHDEYHTDGYILLVTLPDGRYHAYVFLNKYSAYFIDPQSNTKLTASGVLINYVLGLSEFYTFLNTGRYARL